MGTTHPASGRLPHGSDIPRAATVSRFPLKTTALSLARGDAQGLANALERAGDDIRAQVGLCETLMATYAELWADDSCSDFDIAMGLALAQVAFRRYAAVHEPPDPVEGVPLLVVPVHDEPHLLGCVLATAMLARAGIRASYQFPRDDNELARLLDQRVYCGLALVSSGVFSRIDRVARIHATADMARLHAMSSFKVAVYGQLAAADERSAHLTGADGACESASELADFF